MDRSIVSWQKAINQCVRFNFPESCSGIKCGPGRRCGMRHGRPQCVCAPQCGGAAGARPGPVCGTDGRTYKSLCRLRKRACRRRNKHLTLDYYGQCHSKSILLQPLKLEGFDPRLNTRDWGASSPKSPLFNTLLINAICFGAGSCAHIRCGSNRHCLVDQHEGPHCVKCTHSCSRSLPSSQHDTRPVCGTDGNTYPSACHLQNAACRAGRAIPLAYRGPCNRKYFITFGYLCENVLYLLETNESEFSRLKSYLILKRLWCNLSTVKL